MPTQTPDKDSQLDRIDGKLDQVLDRLTRMEERAEMHGGKLHAHQTRLDEHATRLRDVEIANAVGEATSIQSGEQMKGRWAALGAVALVILGGIGAFVGNALVRFFDIGG